MVIFKSWFCVKTTSWAVEFPELHIPKSSGDFSLLCPEVSFFVFLSHSVEPRLLRCSKGPVLSPFEVVWYSGGHVGPVHSTVCGGSRGSFNVGVEEQRRLSPVSLYGLFLKNRVNKTQDAEPRILISCLGLWGETGEAGWGRNGQNWTWEWGLAGSSGRVRPLLGENCSVQLR